MIQEEKRAVLGRLVYGVYIVGAGAGEEIHGFTASWVSQISAQPPQIMVAVNKQGRANEMIRKAGSFSLSLLTKDQGDLAIRFAGGPAADAQVSDPADLFRTREGGSPVLKRFRAFVDCALVEILSAGGDHDLFVGSVADAGEPGKGDPLVLHESGLPYHGV